MKIKFSLVALLLCAVPLLATVYHQYSLEPPQIQASGQYTRITLAGATPSGDPGSPALPWLGSKLLLPLGSQASRVEVERSDPRHYKLDKPLKPIQQQYPLSLEETPPPTLPDPAIYQDPSSWPQTPHSGPNTQFLAGHPLSFTLVCPFDYNPVSGELVFYARIGLRVETAPSPQAVEACALLKDDAHTAARLERLVDNPAALSRGEGPTTGYEYLIIHDAAKASLWLPLKALYEARGMNVLMKPVSEIYAQTAGATNQQKIRNYIISLYAANSLRYVFLAGDTDVIPARGLYASSGSYTDSNIPADIFYSSLDGNWNADGDSYWGEIGEADLIPELAIGRFCYNSDAEIANFLAKLTDYLNTPEESETKMALFLGEQLNSDPTWGGDYMDELIDGSSANGYTTTGIPSSWNPETLYDSPGYYWSGADLLPLLSSGYNFVNHLGHASTTIGLGITISDLTTDNITNDGDGENFSIISTQGCYSGAFDSECFAEKISSISTAAVAIFANSRYGWYARSSTNSSSQHFHREYIDAIFGEGIHELGAAIADARADVVPYTLNSGVKHWCHYEITLFGDPAMKAWTDTPASITAQLPAAWTTGLDHYGIQTNSPGANLRIKDGASFLYDGFADASGLVYVHLSQVINPGTYDLYITADNRYPQHTQITFEASAEPYLTCSRIICNDSDGLHHFGEQTGFTVTLKNVGLANQVQSGTLTLTSPSPNIQILGGNHAFDPLAVGDSLVIADVFQIGITGAFDDLTPAQFLFTAAFDGLETESHAWLTLNAPVLVLTAYQAVNPVWHIQPGDNPTVDVSISNLGSGHAFSPTLDLVCASPHALLSSSSVPLAPLAPSGQANYSAAFSLDILGSAPLDAPIVVDYSLGAESGAGDEGEFRIYISESGYHFENNLMGFASVDLDPAYFNQWHRDDHRNHSANGSCALKFGGPGPEFYEDSSHGALESPSFRLGADSELRFFHWMSTEPDWDGGLVQMSIDGGDWFQITPEGGYNSYIADNPASPFPAGTPAWSGFFDWTEAVFDLSTHSGDARFRWVFGSDGALSYEGWYIDDISFFGGDEPLPVELASFTATISTQNCVTLTWVTQTETGMRGYHILRASDSNVAGARIVSPMIESTNSSQQQTYFYEDTEVYDTGTYFYWLQANDLDGTLTLNGPVSVYYNALGDNPAPVIPLVTELKAVYPNPFNPWAFIPFSLAQDSKVDLRIYNTRGQIVKHYGLGSKAAGNYRVSWDGTDYNGQILANGVYHIVMTAGKDIYQTRAVLLK